MEQSVEAVGTNLGRPDCHLILLGRYRLGDCAQSVPMVWAVGIYWNQA
jgi:hypothetical protein